ncbi:MAG: peptidase [Thermotoga sp. 4484_232]|nr:zinc metallopeptidase [Thermotogaceae bacterium]OQX58008.1 MAG: peptidase [Thermotoga sp. 4484_232]
MSLIRSEGGGKVFFPLFDPTIIILIPAFLFALWAQILVSSTFSKYSKIKSTTGYTGFELARRLLESAGIYDVSIEYISGRLTDHYDPRTKVVRLSSATYNDFSVASLGVVAHEIGHAIQHAQNYAPLVIRNAMAPVVTFGSNLAWILFLIGLIFSSPFLIKLGIIFFILVVIFTLITLPVEIDASRRALKLLRESVLMPEEELRGVKKVLTAAAMTYVAAVATAIFQLLRMIFIASIFGDRQ